jgi:hypothetical protein
MRKEQLNPLSLAARDGVGLGPCDRTGLVTSGFMNGARSCVQERSGGTWAGFATNAWSLCAILKQYLVR